MTRRLAIWRIVFAIALLGYIATAAALWLPQDVTASPLVFTPDSHSLGEVEQQETFPLRFNVKNTGRTPVKLARVVSDCSCTVPAFVPQILAPQGQVEINAQFNTGNAVGLRQARISVDYRVEPAGPIARTKLVVSATVVPEYDVSPAVLRFTRGQSLTTHVYVRPTRGLTSGLTILNVSTTKPWLIPERSESAANQHDAICIPVSYEADSHRGNDDSAEIRVQTDSQRRPFFEVPVYVTH